MTLSNYALQLFAFLTLVVVQSTAILLFKICQRDGSYTFSPASSVALTEICKLALAGTLHYRYVSSSKAPFWEHVNARIIFHYLGLSLLYTINNQLSFYVLEVADPGSMSLGKSIAPYLCALLLRFTGQHVQQLQWICVIIQCCAIAIVQYDACKGTGYLPMNAYYLIGLATSITAITSVWNQLVIKGFEVQVNLQNSIMYFFGSIIAILSYIYSAVKHGDTTKGFLEGYSTLPILLVVFQAFHGLAVALVYKYADAIVKNFANSSVMAILIALSAYLFQLQTTLHSWLGIVIVLATTYCYMNIAIKMPPPAAANPSEQARLLEGGERKLSENENDLPASKTTTQ